MKLNTIFMTIFTILFKNALKDTMLMFSEKNVTTM